MRLSGSIIPIFIIFNHDLVLMYAVEVSLILVGFEGGAYPHPGVNYVSIPFQRTLICHMSSIGWVSRSSHSSQLVTCCRAIP
jgi:hypothetical protein